VLIIDRQPLIVAAVGRLLSDPPLVAEVLATTRSNEAIELIEHVPIDVVVCDIMAEPISGPGLATLLAARHPPVKVILLADSESEAHLLASLQSGANGFFVKDGPVEEFVAGVGTVLDGQSVLAGALLGRVLSELAGHGGAARDASGQLSPTEYDILAQLGQAESVRSIAETRGVSPKTIRNHLSRIYQKLHVRNRAEAMLWAVRIGLTDPDEKGAAKGAFCQPIAGWVGPGVGARGGAYGARDGSTSVGNGGQV
jgi:DNA-binding NarL/FixJ family response regulator